jgi:diaminopropionate ammonia-lyase
VYSTGQPVRIPGDLITAAEMLSCGEASAPALRILLRHKAKAIAINEAILAEAVSTLGDFGGPTTTPSGACGLAGLLSVRPGSATAIDLRIDATSRILLVASEASVPAMR